MTVRPSTIYSRIRRADSGFKKDSIAAKQKHIEEILKIRMGCPHSWGEWVLCNIALNIKKRKCNICDLNESKVV